jgi:hypothetical protein
LQSATGLALVLLIAVCATGGHCLWVNWLAGVSCIALLIVVKIIDVFRDGIISARYRSLDSVLDHPWWVDAS